MLRKLMKYDLKYYRKIMLPLWAVLIIYGIVHGINTVFNYETFYDHIPIKAQAIVVVTGIYFIFCVNIIRFKCEDTGIGMSESFQKTIYEPFAQEKAGARTVYGGTGLGMPITKSLVEKMGGTISFESEQGVGTTFYIELPFQIDHNIKHEELKTKEIKKASIKGVNVLLVEDNELNMEIAEFVLESAGANVIKAFNGKEALEIFKESKLGEIDIILMDVMMPVMDGLEAARYIRWSNKENARDIPIIAMTANAFTEDRRRVLEAGMNEHLAKPLESEVLIKTIANYCGKVDHFK